MPDINLTLNKCQVCFQPFFQFAERWAKTDGVAWWKEPSEESPPWKQEIAVFQTVEKIELCSWPHSFELNIEMLAAPQATIHLLTMWGLWIIKYDECHPSCKMHCPASIPPLFLLVPMETPVSNNTGLSYWTTIAPPLVTQRVPIPQGRYTKWKQFDTPKPAICHPCATRKGNTYIIMWSKVQTQSLRLRENNLALLPGKNQVL